MMNAAALQTETIQVTYLPIDIIRPNPYQPRKIFDKFALEELAQSIKEYGVLQPINVRSLGTSYELISGERRLRASKLAGLAKIPAVIMGANDKDSAIVALIENLQRQNLNYLEEAIGFQNLMSDYGLTQEELAVKLGKSQSTIANKLRLLRLSKDVKRILLDNDLSERHARALLRIPNEEIQLKILSRVVAEGLTVKKTEELVAKLLDKIRQKDLTQEEEIERKQKIKRVAKDLRLYTNTVLQAVEVIKNAGAQVEYAQHMKENQIEIIVSIKKESVS